MPIRLLLVGVLLFVHCGGPSPAERARALEDAPGAQQQSDAAPSDTHAIDVDERRAATAAARAALEPPAASPESRDVAAFYEVESNEFGWLDDAGHLTPAAHTGITLIGGAASEGLDPNDYNRSELSILAGSLERSSPIGSETAGRFDVLLTTSVLRYFRHVHHGRVAPRTLGLQIDAPDDAHDFPAMLRTAIAENRIEQTAAALAPSLFQYTALKSALGRYRELATAEPRPPQFTGTVHVGDALSESSTLQYRLVLMGDLPAGTPASETGIYDEATSVGVAHFQERHSLNPDGVIGPATQRALHVPFSWRVRQIELALERLRWLPDLGNGRLIAVNIPMFRLWAWNRVPSSEPPALDMNVVVGRALDTRTPVFADHMEYIVFRPYWNVPRSIVRNETIPSIRKNPNYLAGADMELVRGDGDNSPIVPPSPEHVEELARGTLRVRQRPGPRNALGLVKFMFPNQNDVYMHSTPATQLFQRERRDFSHGCIRVADPVALAEWVLGIDPSWTRAGIQAAMNGAPNRRVDLLQPVQVVIFYTTAVVVPEDGTIHFAEDLYGHDGTLDKVL